VYLKYRQRSNGIPNEIDNVKKLSAVFFQIFRKGWIYILVDGNYLEHRPGCTYGLINKAE